MTVDLDAIRVRAELVGRENETYPAGDDRDLRGSAAHVLATEDVPALLTLLHWSRRTADAMQEQNDRLRAQPVVRVAMRLRRTLFALSLRVRRELSCGCHWHETYGAVVMGGCPRHD